MERRRIFPSKDLRRIKNGWQTMYIYKSVYQHLGIYHLSTYLSTYLSINLSNTLTSSGRVWARVWRLFGSLEAPGEARCRGDMPEI